MPSKTHQKNMLAHALFVTNFLQLDQSGQSEADRLWHPSKENYALILWRDLSTANGRAQTQNLPRKGVLCAILI